MYNILVIDLLGPSLEDMFDTCNRKFSVKTVCLAAKQMVKLIYFINILIYIYYNINIYIFIFIFIIIYQLKII